MATVLLVLKWRRPPSLKGRDECSMSFWLERWQWMDSDRWVAGGVDRRNAVEDAIVMITFLNIVHILQK